MNTPSNIVIILADDLGFSDLGSFGGEIETPNLDRLAERGVRLSSFYVTPRCSPSRAALLTGHHPHSVGVGILTRDDQPNGYAGSLDVTVPTIASTLRDRGYATGLTGKWHLSSDTATPNETWPTSRGFDEFYGILGGCGSYFLPRVRRGNERVPDVEFDDDYYFTDDVSRAGVEFASRSMAEGTPFFLYLAYTAPHWPLHALEEDIAPYRERYLAGWDRLRQSRLERQRELGLSTADVLSARDEGVADWSETAEQEWEAERMAVYAAQVTAMDRGVGELLSVLEEAGQLDDTLIIFSSDNGACAEQLPPVGGPEALGDDQFPRETRSGEPVEMRNESDVWPGAENTYTSYGPAWANLSNAPFRLYKRWVHEGGISSPLIASWPNGGVDGGRIVESPAHIVDVVPTILEAVGSPAADLPGLSLLSAMRGVPSATDRSLYWEHIGNAAVRRGRWKLVRQAERPWELYDIEADRGESRDLSELHPELVDNLSADWGSWATRTGVLPWDAVLSDYRARGLPEIAAKG